MSQLDPKQVPLSAVVVQYLHFRAGISELRAPPVCWHEAGWQWQPTLGSPRALCVAQGSEKSGPVVACGLRSGVGSWEGEVSPAAGVRLPGTGQIQPSWARSGQPREEQPGHHHLSAAKMLNGFICLGKCWWSSADSCKDSWANWKSYSGCLMEVVVTLLRHAYTELSFWESKSRTKIGGFWAYWLSAPCSALLKHLPEVSWLLLSFSIEQRQYMKAVPFRKRKYFKK